MYTQTGNSIFNKNHHHIINQKGYKNINKINQQQTCCICGSSNCFQSIDHQKITVRQIKKKIKIIKTPNPKVQQLKKKINELYKSIRYHIQNIIKRQENKANQWFNRFNYQGCSQQGIDINKIDVNLLSQIQQGNYQSLPKKSIKTWIKYLNQIPSKNQSSSQDDFQSKKFKYSKHVNQFLNNFNSEKLYNQLKIRFFTENIKPEQQLASPKLKSMRSIQSNPEEVEKVSQYNWRNVKLTQRSKNANLSNKNLNDQDVIQQLQILASFKNLKQFQIRYNLITYLTCQYICDTLSFIISLDIRGNKIGDKGAIILIKGLPKLKSIMLSQTNITDQTAKEIAQGAQQLDTLWCQNNEITDKYLYQIINKPKIKVLSLIGNNISKEVALDAKKCFGVKGYIAF